MTGRAVLPEACQAVADDLAELALGVLPGRERAAALAHLDECDRCRAEVEQLSMAADGVVRATPHCQPPSGFEERVLAAMTAKREKRGAIRERQRRLGLALGLAAALAVLAVLVGVGVASGGGGTGSATPSVRHPYSSATLVSDGRSFGNVKTFEGSGSQPAWLWMTIHDRGGTGWIRCQITVRGGSAVTLGSFWVENGTGHWDSALPVSVRADQVTGAQVLGPGAVVLATARFRS